jgi:hypothetical protein
MFIWLPPTEALDSRPTPDEERENPPSAPDSSVLPDSVPSRAIREFVGMPLCWVQLEISTRPTYELRCAEEILGFMHYEDASYGRVPRGLARTKEGTWSFRGYKREVTIETDKGGCTLVRPYPRRGFGPFRPPFRGPTLSLPNGHDYFLFLKTWWWFLEDYYRWRAADDTALVTFSVRGFIKRSGEVGVHSPAAALPELDLLITLGLYLVLTPPERETGA